MSFVQYPLFLLQFIILYDMIILPHYYDYHKIEYYYLRLYAMLIGALTAYTQYTQDFVKKYRLNKCVLRRKHR